MTADTVERSAFVHTAFFYRSNQDYLAELTAFINEGLACGQPVAVAVPGEKLTLLNRALGKVTGDVRKVDMGEAGRNPGRIIAGVLRSFADEHPERSVRIVGEPVWRGRTETEYPACVQHEALINAAFDGRAATILCPYDASGLDARALRDAQATHPFVREDGRHFGSEAYAPAAALERYNQVLNGGSGGSGTASYVLTTATELGRARRFATDYAAAVGLSPDRVDDLALIANELVTNSLLHTDGACWLRLWQQGDHLVCEVVDVGRLTDPLAGRVPAEPGEPNGRGLLLVHNLADLVRQHTSEHGTTIRAYLQN